MKPLKVKKVSELQEEVKCCYCGGKGHILVPNPAALKEKRISNGLSLRSVAKSLNFSPAYISDVENGKRRCSDMILYFYEMIGNPNNPIIINPSK